MNSYDDVAALKSKIAQKELDFQTFNDKQITFSSSWALLNELLHGVEQPKAPQSAKWTTPQPTSVTQAQPTASVVADEPVAPTTDATAPETSASNTPASDLSSILKKVSR